MNLIVIDTKSILLKEKNIKMKITSIEEISDIIIDTVLEQRIINRVELKKTIRPTLSVWLKKCNVPKTNKSFEATINKLTAENKIRINNYKKKLAFENVKQKGYRDKLIESIGIDEVKKLDDYLNSLK